MNKKTFINLCVSSGYAKRDAALEWCEKHQKEAYDDADFMEVYRYANGPKRGGHHDAWAEYGDGNRSTLNSDRDHYRC